MRSEDKFSRWFGMSLALHLALFSAAVVWPSLLTLRGDTAWGSSTGNSEGIQVKIASGISGIPLPSPPVVQDNSAANASKGLYTNEPAPETKAEEKKVDETPEVQIPAKNAPKKPEPKPRQVAANTPPPAPVPDNAVPFGRGGQPAVQYGQFASGAGNTGYSFGDGAFGDRYGWYVNAMITQISRNWLRPALNISSTPRVYASFTIGRDGTLSDIRIDQPSGIPTLDQSAERALRVTNKLQPLPGDYRGSSVNVRFYFEYVH
jgi:protein TonB